MIYERYGELNGREHRASRSLQCENVISFFSFRYKIIIWVCFILTLLLVLTFLILKINLSLLGKLLSIKQFLSDSCDLLTLCEGGVWSKPPPMSKRSLSLSGDILTDFSVDS